MQTELVDNPAGLARSIEAVLFVASEALSIKSLAKLTGAAEANVSLALARIDAEYAERGIVLREIAGGYRFASAPAARGAVEAYLRPPKTNLSPAALETLAIVAYMQPVTKGDVEGIRGVSADSVLSTLVDRRLLAEAGRKDVAGRPILYRTTTEFLESFGLRSLEELPPIDIDVSAPIELALPIQTRTVPLPTEENSDPSAAVVESAAVDETAAESAVDETAAESAVDETAAESAVDETAAESAVVDETAAESAAVDETAAESAVVDETAAESAVVDETAAESAAVDETVENLFAAVHESEKLLVP